MERGVFGTMIRGEDISATIGLVFRFAASILAFAVVVYYLVKDKMAKSTGSRLNNQENF
jgi:hypothetical protein